MLTLLCLALGSVGQPAAPAFAATAPVQEVRAAEAPQEPRFMEYRLHLGVRQVLFVPITQPDLALEVLLPRNHLVFDIHSHAFSLAGYGSHHPLDMAGVAIQGGLMSRLDGRNASGLGLTQDFRALAGLHVVGLSIWSNVPRPFPGATINLDAETTYWLAPSSGIALRAQAGFTSLFGFTAKVSGGVAF